MGTTLPEEFISRYVTGLTLVYVGTKGYSTRYSRTDFYSDSAAIIVKAIFEKFDDFAIESFIKTIKNNRDLRERIQYPEKLSRLRQLGTILLDRPNISEDNEDYLTLLIDKSRYLDFVKTLKKI